MDLFFCITRPGWWPTLPGPAAARLASQGTLSDRHPKQITTERPDAEIGSEVNAHVELVDVGPQGLLSRLASIAKALPFIK